MAKRGLEFIDKLLTEDITSALVFTHAALIFNLMKGIRRNRQWTTDLADLDGLSKPPGNCHYHEFLIENQNYHFLKLNASFNTLQ